MYDKTMWGTTRRIPDTPGEDGWASDLTGLLDDLVDLAEGTTYQAGGIVLPFALATTSTMAAGASLTRTHPIHKLVGNGGAVTLDPATAIADGAKDGELLTLVGGHMVNVVTIPDGANVDLARGASITLLLGDELHLRFDLARGVWNETGRSSAALWDGGTVDLYELKTNGSDKVTLKAPDSLAASYTLTLPPDDGASAQFLRTDGSGVLSWANGTSTLQSAYDQGRTVAVVDAQPMLLTMSADSYGFQVKGPAPGNAILAAGMVSGAPAFGTTTNHNLSLRTNNTEKAILDTTGHLYLLAGNFRVANTKVFQGDNAAGNPLAIAAIDGSNVLLIGDTGSATDMRFQNTGAAEFAGVAGLSIGDVHQAAAKLEVVQAADLIGLRIIKTGTGHGEALYIDQKGDRAGFHVLQEGDYWAAIIEGAGGAYASCRIQQTGASAALSLNHDGTGHDIEGTASSWYMQRDGGLACLSLKLTNGQIWKYGSAAPGSGSHVVGEIVWNQTPTSGGTIGWVCTGAGTPGTWKTFGTIA